MTNVTQLHQDQPLTPEQTSHRILAAVRATHVFLVQLEATDSRLRAIEKQNLSDATHAYRELIREAEERGDTMTPEDSHKMLPRICAGLRARDDLKKKIDDDRKDRTAERNRVHQALAELQGPARDDAQLSLDVDSTGLAWFCSDTVAVVYTALLDADGRGTIDAVQLELLAELGGAGMEAIEFVIDAADAIEEEPEGTDDEAIAELDEIADGDLPV